MARLKPFLWNATSVKQLIFQGLREDAARHDITTQTLVPPHCRVHAIIRSKQSGVVCGLPLAQAFFKAVDSRCGFTANVHEGQWVTPRTRLATLQGKARAILSAERSALNALQHLSGIATFTRQQVRRLGTANARIFDTRKTLPAWRYLQKYAVRCGGGVNHRTSLADEILVKDNHLKICRLLGINWKTKIERFHQRNPSVPVEVEVQSAQDLREVLTLAPACVLLDNMAMSKLRPVVKLLRTQQPHTKIEISGGIKQSQLKALAALGVDRISMGKLTHSAPAFDCSLEILSVHR